MTAGSVNRIELIVVGSILFFTLLTRFLFLGSLPEGLFRDEAEKGYTALELWETGRHGVLGADGIRVTGPFPIFIEVYDGHDRTSAIYQYLSAPIVGLFGLTELTTRFVAATAGCAVIVLFWAFIRIEFRCSLAALAAAVALLFHPTLFVFSRWAQQGIVALALLCTMLLFLAFSRRDQHRVFALTAGIFGGLAAYAYDPFRLIIPIIAVGYLAIFWLELRKIAVYFVVPLLLSVGPLIVYTMGAGSARLDRVGIFSAEASPSTIILQNIMSFLSPSFWFVVGDQNIRHQLPLNGFAGTVTTLVGLIGSLWLVATKRREPCARQLLLIALFAAASPAAAILTVDGNPHALRALPLVLLVPLMVALVIREWSASRVWLAALLLVVLTVDGTRMAVGAIQWNQIDASGFERGVQPSLRFALSDPQQRPVILSALIPYASYHALFAEQTDPRIYQELGLGALRARIEMAGEVERIPVDHWLVAPPLLALPAEYQRWFAIPYLRDGDMLRYLLPNEQH